MELVNFYTKRKKHIHSFVKAIPFFLCIGVMMLLVFPWKGEYHPHGKLTKAEFLYILLIIYGVILSIITSFIAIVFLIAKSFEALFSRIKFFNFFKKQEEFTIQDALLTVGLFTLAASLSYSIISLFVYQH